MKPAVFEVFVWLVVGFFGVLVFFIIAIFYLYLNSLIKRLLKKNVI